jgi:hypothetical protein
MNKGDSTSHRISVNCRSMFVGGPNVSNCCSSCGSEMLCSSMMGVSLETLHLQDDTFCILSACCHGEIQ